jgi:hypothetical protein
MAYNLNLGNLGKLIPTWKTTRKFGLKFEILKNRPFTKKIALATAEKKYLGSGWGFVGKNRALHSELSSRVSSRNELGRVSKKLEKLVPTLIFKKRLVSTLIFAKKRVYSRKLGSEQVGTSRDEFGKSSKNSFRP